MMILPIGEQVLKMVDIEPWFFLTFNEGLITDFFAGSQTTGFGPGARSEITSTPDFHTGIMVIVGYAIIFFLIGLFFANRRKGE